jgi:oligopeptide transport system substrate-binding protein
MARQFLSLLSLPVVLSLIVSGCTSRSGSNTATTPDGRKLELKASDTIRINLSTEPPTLDWNKATDTTSSHILNNVMEGLVSYNLADKELALVPALALEWSTAEKGRVWTFKLRPGVKWSDGVDFTGQQVVDSWRRLMAKETASEYAYFLFGIKNGKAFNEGKVPFEQVGISLPTPDTLRVELEKPMAYFPQLMTHASTFPIRLDLIKKFGDKWNEAGNLASLGPYKLAIWQHDREVVLEANDSYYGTKPLIKYVHGQMIIEQATAINLFDAGKLDAVDALPSVQLKTQRKRKEFRTTGLLQTYFYPMNVTKPPMDNVHVRRAIAHAIDRQKVVQVLDGGQIPLTGWVPSGMFGYFSDVGLEFNLDTARAELAKAGYGEGKKKLPKIEIHFNTNEDHQRIGEIVQAQLKENLGIDIELKNEEWKTYLANLRTNPPQMYRFGWLADYPDPDNYMNLMTSYSDNNRTRWKDPAYDKIVEQAAGELDVEKRRELYRKAHKILLEEGVPVIPLFTSVTHLLVSNRVENFPVNAMRRFEYKAVRIKP